MTQNANKKAIEISGSCKTFYSIEKLKTIVNEPHIVYGDLDKHHVNTRNK